MNKYSILESGQMHILYAALHTSNLTAIQKIKREILERYKIDLDNENIVSALSADQLHNLKEYETDQLNFLLSILINEYPDSADYFAQFQNSANPYVEKLKSDKLRRLVGVICLVLSFGYISALTWLPVPTTNVRFADTSLGVVLGTVITQILGYFFGRDETGQMTNSLKTSRNRDRDKND